MTQPRPIALDPTAVALRRAAALATSRQEACDVPSATAILDRFLHHAEVIAITGKSYRLRNQATPTAQGAEESKPANLPTGSAGRKKHKPAAETVAACEM